MKRETSCKFTIEEEKTIIEEYQNGSSFATLGKKYTCSPSTISNILRAYNIKARTPSEARRNYLKYEIDEAFFEEINTPEKAYWLGFMYADGYISKTNSYTNYFGLSLASRDIDALKKFKKALKTNAAIHNYISTTGFSEKETSYSRLLIGNNKIVADLEKWGVVEHKTFKITTLPEILFLDDFIRGYIDGDGSLVKRTKRLIISGGKEFLLNIAEYLNIPYAGLYEDKAIYNLQYRANETSYLENRLYNGACCYLDRKYNIAKRSFI